MKLPGKLLLLLLVFSFYLHGQDLTTEINKKWNLVKSLLQQRSDIITNLTKALSKTNVDRRIRAGNIRVNVSFIAQ
jgi:hypothetical protein